jgi:hypothetical protein
VNYENNELLLKSTWAAFAVVSMSMYVKVSSRSGRWSRESISYEFIFKLCKSIYPLVLIKVQLVSSHSLVMIGMLIGARFFKSTSANFVCMAWSISFRQHPQQDLSVGWILST